MLRLSARLARSEEGATVVEFALVAPVFLMMVMGLFDMGYNMYTDQMLNGAIQQAARNSALESGAGAVAALDNNVSQAVGAIAYGATMTFERKSFSSFTDVVHGEDFSDLNEDGTCDFGEPYEDANSNGTWDAQQGSAGLGGARDAVVYTVTVNYPRLFPVFAFIPGQSEDFTLKSTTVLRNQPYGQSQNAVPAMGNCT